MLTIFTPTYNRANTLIRLYDSLVGQTDSCFEWIVVDDGSTDETMSTMQAIINTERKRDGNFKIRYYYQSNGGKHRAVNRGVNLASGDYFMIVDSDDFLTRDAIERVYQWIKLIDEDERIAGVAGLKQDFDENIVGQRSNKPFVDVPNFERRKYKLMGDKAEIYKTKLLKKYPFPEFEGENFISEAVVWNEIAEAGYKIRWFNDPIYYCEYRDDGLTKNISRKYKDNPKGFLLYVRQLIRHERNPIRKVMLYSLYAKEAYEYTNLDLVADKLGISKPILSLAIIIRQVLQK